MQNPFQNTYNHIVRLNALKKNYKKLTLRSPRGGCLHGESGRNAYCRGGEHLDNLAFQDEEKSVLLSHSVHHHNRREDVKYAMRVSGAYNEALDRQIMERVQISSFKRPILMNRKNKMGGIRVERTRYRRWGGD